MKPSFAADFRGRGKDVPLPGAAGRDPSPQNVSRGLLLPPEPRGCSGFHEDLSSILHPPQQQPKPGAESQQPEKKGILDPVCSWGSGQQCLVCRGCRDPKGATLHPTSPVPKSLLQQQLGHKRVALFFTTRALWLCRSKRQHI